MAEAKRNRRGITGPRRADDAPRRVLNVNGPLKSKAVKTKSLRTSLTRKRHKKTALGFPGAEFFRRTGSPRAIFRKFLLLDLLQKGKSGGNVLGDFITFRQCVERTVLRFTSEKIQGDGLSTFKHLLPAVQDVIFSGFFAFYCVSHSLSLGWFKLQGTTGIDNKYKA